MQNRHATLESLLNETGRLDEKKWREYTSLSQRIELLRDNIQRQRDQAPPPAASASDEEPHEGSPLISVGSATPTSSGISRRQVVEYSAVTLVALLSILIYYAPTEQLEHCRKFLLGPKCDKSAEAQELPSIMISNFALAIATMNEGLLETFKTLPTGQKITFVGMGSIMAVPFAAVTLSPKMLDIMFAIITEFSYAGIMSGPSAGMLSVDNRIVRRIFERIIFAPLNLANLSRNLVASADARMHRKLIQLQLRRYDQVKRPLNAMLGSALTKIVRQSSRWSWQKMSYELRLPTAVTEGGENSLYSRVMGLDVNNIHSEDSLRVIMELAALAIKNNPATPSQLSRVGSALYKYVGQGGAFAVGAVASAAAISGYLADTYNGLKRLMPNYPWLYLPLSGIGDMALIGLIVRYNVPTFVDLFKHLTALPRGKFDPSLAFRIAPKLNLAFLALAGYIGLNSDATAEELVDENFDNSAWWFPIPEFNSQYTVALFQGLFVYTLLQKGTLAWARRYGNEDVKCAAKLNAKVAEIQFELAKAAIDPTKREGLKHNLSEIYNTTPQAANDPAEMTGEKILQILGMDAEQFAEWRQEVRVPPMEDGLFRRAFRRTLFGGRARQSDPELGGGARQPTMQCLDDEQDRAAHEGFGSGGGPL